MFTLTTPAKINWFLSVLGKREDGYHNISSLMQCVTLYDKLVFDYSDGIEVKTEADIPKGKNLVYRAALLLRERFSVKKGATIILSKDIPIAAGLGGGSSDAACALIGLNRLWGLCLSEKELSEFGAMLGSDVPFFFKCPLAAVSGRGEKTRRMKAKSPIVILLVNPNLRVSAGWAYTELSRQLRELTKEDNNIKLFVQAIDRRDFKTIASMMRNDLETSVIKEYKVIGELKDKLLKEGAVCALMSGSGPTVYGLFESLDRAERAAEAMKPNWSRVVETIT